MADAVSCDVLVIGSGAGGLSAAITAGYAGADVVVAETAEKIGGTTAYSGGHLWVGLTDQAARAGVDDSATDVNAYLEYLSEGRADPSLREVFVSQGPDAIRFLGERGVPIMLVRGAPDYFYPVAPGAKPEGRIHEIEPWDERQLGDLLDRVATSPYGAGWISTQDRVDAGSQAPTAELTARRNRHFERGERCAGPGLSGALVHAASLNGASFSTGARVVRLHWDGSRVSGATIREQGREREIAVRRGVILATGGYDWNPERLSALDQVHDLESMAPDTTRGDHFDLTEPLGAAIAIMRQPHTSGAVFGTRTPGEQIDGRPAVRSYTPGLPHSIVVNSLGRRFADDAFHVSLIGGVVGGPDRMTPNWPIWVIADQQYIDKYGIGAVGPGKPVPDGMAQVASTLEELASAAGIDTTGLIDEVGRFNRFSELGRDEDFGRGSRPYTRVLRGDPRMPNPNLGALESPPYYAFPLSRVGVNCPAAGLVTGREGEVLDGSGTAIPGLYAVGNCSAQRDIGAGYNSGIGNQRGLLYGYLAANALTAQTVGGR